MRSISALQHTDRWITCQKPNPAATLRLFCFPYGGGDAATFNGWAASLPSCVEVWAARLPGRGQRVNEAPFTSLTPLVEALADAMFPLLEARPFAFFGHSMGALLAFELAHLCSDEFGLRPARIYVSGQCAPHLPRTDPPSYDLPEPDFLNRIREMNGTSAAVLANSELMQMLLPALRADFAICETYTCAHRTPLSCPISAYGGLRDESVSRVAMQAWRLHTDDTLTVRMFPGDHFFIRSAQPLVLDTLARELFASSITNARLRNERGGDRTFVA